MSSKLQIRQSLKPGERLTTDRIKELVETHDVSRFIELERYAEGRNPKILSRVMEDPDAPNNRVPIAMGKRIISTMTGYLFKTGLISYTSPDESYLKRFQEIHTKNNGDLVTFQIGRQTSVNGIGYELHYLGKDKIPRFVKADVKEIIPVYDYSIVPELVAAIRHYSVGDGEWIDVYYSDVVSRYRMKDNKISEREPEAPHYYGTVPLVVYRNNETMTGDFEPILELIDAYDILISDSLNEIDKFSLAYLILRNLKMDDEDLRRAKELKVFEIQGEKGTIEYLTKNLPTDYIRFLTEKLERLIHELSQIPDFLETKTGDQLSGIAVSKLLYDFENLASIKEGYFREGLHRRIELINAIINKAESVNGTLEITWGRNIPQSLQENADVFERLMGKGISLETLITNLVPFVKNPRAEMEKYKQEAVDGYHPEAEEGFRRESTFSEPVDENAA